MWSKIATWKALPPYMKQHYKDRVKFGMFYAVFLPITAYAIYYEWHYDYMNDKPGTGMHGLRIK